MDADELRVTYLPKLEANGAVGDSIARTIRVLSSQRRLQTLLDASNVVASDLDLEHVLRRIAEEARIVADAEYAALGVIAADGSLERFIHVGMAQHVAEKIGDLPAGHGVLGAVNQSSNPIRLTDLTTDPRAVGFPAHHPPMNSFLGVPIKIRGETYGNLYLTNRADGPFTDEDEELVTALAATAATAINNARLYEEARRAQQLSAVLGDVTSALLASETIDVFGVLAHGVATLTEADFAAIVTSDAVGEELFIDTARGQGASLIEGEVLPWVEGAVSRAMEGTASISPPEGTDVPPFCERVPSSSVIAVPLIVSGDRIGAVCATRAESRPAFDSGDLELLSDFATQAGLAVALSWARADRQRLGVIEDRARTARDLHDHVIQRLFATGLGLQAFASAHPRHCGRIDRHVAEIDAAIEDIRNAIFTLRTRKTTRTMRHRLLDVVTELSAGLGMAPKVTFTGQIDAFIKGELADDVVAVLRETVTNVTRHARATAVSIEVQADSAGVTVTVGDDGVGLAAGDKTASGTANLRARAGARGGAFGLTPGENGGVRARWHVPVHGQDVP
ncbi:GAF domain-containing protein [Nesterenkonia sp. LB17]|uniref:GAF domain-containing sensor histidine kinase n=1 Tax=Nesterenkonia sp. LB17 TaxID=2901230 RepID=UPI001F4D0ED1|nr:GAF domain-containing protein [Nesterenkonia sp. LB17]MCH8566535.1 GAF domain-containing protein [Nesterenkonia sp. LB17]